MSELQHTLKLIRIDQQRVQLRMTLVTRESIAVRTSCLGSPQRPTGGASISKGFKGRRCDEQSVDGGERELWKVQAEIDPI